jgi:hypothetical protein
MLDCSTISLLANLNKCASAAFVLDFKSHLTHTHWILLCFIHLFCLITVNRQNQVLIFFFIIFLFCLFVLLIFDCSFLGNLIFIEALFKLNLISYVLFLNSFFINWSLFYIETRFLLFQKFLLCVILLVKQRNLFQSYFSSQSIINVISLLFELSDYWF